MANVSLNELRERVAEALAGSIKSYNLPAICTRLGLAPGETSEANASKRLYVRNRLLGHDREALLKFAQAALEEVADPALADLLSEMTTHAVHRVSEITRRDVLKALNTLPLLFGDVPLCDALSLISSEPIRPVDPLWSEFAQPLEKAVDQHYLRNDDWSHEELLIECGALTCSQARFFSLIEKLLDPVVRRGDEQTALAETLNAILKNDGFCVAIAGERSRYPVYSVRRIAPGISGRPKNLIFAATNVKPDLVFVDAINNDVVSTNGSNALIYDEPFSSAGLSWKALVEWWKVRENEPDLRTAERNLYKRLLRAVRHTRSPGALALFVTYYSEFRASYGERLPALIPEVYLHYDPRTHHERGRDPVLLRQRMDLLLLLENNARVIIEVDGKHHYADDNDRAAPRKYAELVAEDRRLRLLGYEVYRFGGAEFDDVVIDPNGRHSIGPAAKKLAIAFFETLLKQRV